MTTLNTRPAPKSATPAPDRDAVRHEVWRMALMMEAQLKRNDSRGGWKDCDRVYFMEKLDANLRDLGYNLKAGEPKTVIGRDCADIANFAMMLADVEGALLATPSHPSAGRDEVRTALEQKVYEAAGLLGPPYAPNDIDEAKRRILQALTPSHPSAGRDEVREAAELAVAEFEKATRKFPTWPTDPLHALSVLGEEFGELTKAMLQQTYEPHKTSKDEIKTEAIQTAAMALRVLVSLDRYEYTRCAQHSQALATPQGKERKP